MADIDENRPGIPRKTERRYPVLFWLGVLSLLSATLATGLFVWVPRLQRQRAIEEINRLGGSVFTQRSSTRWGERFLDEMSGSAGQVVVVDLSAAKVDDETMTIFSSFSQIRSIMIGGDQLTDHGIQKLKANSQLQFLMLVNCPKVSEEALRKLQKEIPGLRISRRGPALLGVMGTRGFFGCRITNVRTGTAASIGGIRVRDIIIQINKKPISGFESLAAEIEKYYPGDKIQVTIIRDGQRRTLPITLQSWGRSAL